LSIRLRKPGVPTVAAHGICLHNLLFADNTSLLAGNIIIPVHFFDKSDNVAAFKQDTKLLIPFLITSGDLYAAFNDSAENAAE
ncbi:hypothetical protein HK100_009838, partial [Physocladia obscura]